MDWCGKGEGQRMTIRLEKRGHGWGGLRFFCLSVWVRFCSEEEQKEEQRKKRDKKKEKWRRKKETEKRGECLVGEKKNLT